MLKYRFSHAAASALVLACFCASLQAQETATAKQETAAVPAAGDAAIAARNAKFSKMFSGVKLRGQFTVDGKPMSDLTDEAYEIVRARKLPKGDQWSIEARIKYGKYNVVVPIPLDVKWAGDTPVLTLEDLTIPGMGTFSARVVFHKGKYAGTWSHGKVGGHLFGKLEFAKDSKPAADSPTE